MQQAGFDIFFSSNICDGKGMYEENFRGNCILFGFLRLENYRFTMYAALIEKEMDTNVEME